METGGGGGGEWESKRTMCEKGREGKDEEKMRGNR